MQIIKFLIMKCPPTYSYLLFPFPKHYLQHFYFGLLIKIFNHNDTSFCTLSFTKQVGSNVSYPKDTEHFPIKHFRKFTNISSSKDKINAVNKRNSRKSVFIVRTSGLLSYLSASYGTNCTNFCDTVDG